MEECREDVGREEKGKEYEKCCQFEGNSSKGILDSPLVVLVLATRVDSTPHL